MILDYYAEGDLLEVIFDEQLHRTEQIPYRLRDGLMLFVAADSMKPVQLTIVNYRRLAQLPAFYFNGWKKLKATERKKLLPILASPTISTFLKLDPETGYGHLASSSILEMLPLAA